MEYMQLVKSRQDISNIIIVTNYGKMTFEVYCGKAPNMAEKFLELAINKFFQGKEYEKFGSYLRTAIEEGRTPDPYYDDSSFKDINNDKSLTHS